MNEPIYVIGLRLINIVICLGFLIWQYKHPDSRQIRKFLAVYLISLSTFIIWDLRREIRSVFDFLWMVSKWLIFRG